LQILPHCLNRNYFNHISVEDSMNLSSTTFAHKATEFGKIGPMQNNGHFPVQSF